MQTLGVFKAAKATVEAHATTPNMFNAVFYTITSWRSSKHLLAQASTQKKYQYSVHAAEVKVKEVVLGVEDVPVFPVLKS